MTQRQIKYAQTIECCISSCGVNARNDATFKKNRFIVKPDHQSLLQNLGVLRETDSSSSTLGERATSAHSSAESTRRVALNEEGGRLELVVMDAKEDDVEVSEAGGTEVDDSEVSATWLIGLGQPQSSAMSDRIGITLNEVIIMTAER
jgi:hypothetical protein